MGQITIYLDTQSEQMLRSRAKQKKISVSKYVRLLVREKSATEWPEKIISSAGTWEDYPAVADIRGDYGEDIRRNEL